VSGKKAIVIAVGFAALLVFGGHYLVGNVILKPGARESGQLLACQATLIRIQRGIEMYAREHDKKYPPHWSDLEPYLQALDPEHPREICSAAGRETYRLGYRCAPDQSACTVVCTGQNHPGVPPDFPRWSSQEGLRER
jgi:hypothetical protein